MDLGGKGTCPDAVGGTVNYSVEPGHVMDLRNAWECAHAKAPNEVVIELKGDVELSRAGTGSHNGDNNDGLWLGNANRDYAPLGFGISAKLVVRKGAGVSSDRVRLSRSSSATEQFRVVVSWCRTRLSIRSSAHVSHKVPS